MRDAIKTGIALILLTLATALLLIAVMGYLRAEGWLDIRQPSSLFLHREDAGTAGSGE